MCAWVCGLACFRVGECVLGSQQGSVLHAYVLVCFEEP